MSNIIKKEFYLDGKLITLETGRIARQANSSVLVSSGGNTVLCSVVVSPSPSEGCDFLPLTVNYIEKYYAVGKIPGGYLKREGKPSDFSILASRLIDRSIRPIISDNFYNDINVTCTVLSYDGNCSLEILSIIGVSAAISTSGIPTKDIVGSARIGLKDDSFFLNSSESYSKESILDLTISGTNSSILMIESEAKELKEEILLKGIEYGHKYIRDIIIAVTDFKDKCEKKIIYQNNEDEKINLIKGFAYADLKDKLSCPFGQNGKKQRVEYLKKLCKDLEERLIKDGNEAFKVKIAIEASTKKIIREYMLQSNLRVDGRSPDQVRQISIETGILPQSHGSSLFTRGETQSLGVITLGSGSKDRQLVDGISSKNSEEHFMLHYNFPPYSVGEVGPLRSPGRREIGHGKLAWKAINPVLPSLDSFNYAIRVVSEIMESDGSSSMATVCAASLALMDAGVPIKSQVSGIAMGLIKEGDKFIILSDIMGDEDHFGDMDFKVAGTKDGVTALQMDMKISGINIDIIKEALNQAYKGRMHILDKMNEIISNPRNSLSSNVPKIEVINIQPRKIKDIIGPRGATIKEICASSGANIDVDDSGLIKISSNNSDSMKKAIEMINEITFEPELGDIFEGPVVKVIDAGAFVSIAPNKDGFVHISELADYRVDFVEDVINEGDIVKTKVIGFDKKGRPKLSYRSVDQATGEDISSRINSDRSNTSDSSKFDSNRSNTGKRF